VTGSFLNFQIAQVHTPHNTGSQSVIGDSIIEKNAYSQIEQALNGTISGLYSIRNTGQRFGNSNHIFLLRGKATTADSSPLILIDGIEGDIQLIDPAEIESVTVLKDAAMLSEYGLKGANGVILFKTKRGNSKSSFMRLNIRTGVQMPLTVSKKLNAFEYSTLHNEATLNDGGSPVFDPSRYIDQTDKHRYPDHNFPGDFLKRSAPWLHYGFSAGGGNEVARYFALISYMRQDGLFKLPSGIEDLNKTYNERYNFRTNLDVNLGNGYVLNTLISAVFDDRRGPWINSSETVNSGSNYIFNLLMNTPANAFPISNANGSLGGSSEYRVNPLGLLQSGKRTENTRKLNANITLNKDLNEWVKGLSAFAQYSFENYNAYYKGNYTTYAVYQLKDDDTYAEYGATDTKVNTVGGQMSDYYNDITFNAGTQLTRHFDQHRIYSSIMYNQHVSNISGDNPALKWIGTSSRLLYAYDDRYLVGLSASYQGSNSFMHGKRFGFFPAVSAAWVMSEESFMENLTYINQIKTRFSYGLTGNDRTGGTRFMHRQAFYNGNGYGFGNPNGTSQGSWEGTLGNPDAGWEKARKLDLGFNVSALNHKLQITADYFNENRGSILVEQSGITPSLIGVSLPKYNSGIISNQGIEATFSYGDRSGKLQYQAGINMLYARNKIIDLKETSFPENESYRYRKGNPVDAIFGFEADGIYNDAESIAAHGVISSFGNLKPGDIKYLDQNGDGIINEADRKVIGNALPAFIFGIETTITYRNFDLYIQGEGSALFEYHMRPGQFSAFAYENRWTDVANGSNASYPGLSLSNDHNKQNSTFWISRGQLFRLSAIEAGYSLPESLTNSLSISGIRVYINLNNILSTSDSRENRDIEAPAAGFTSYPVMKAALVGLTITL
jgi:TonB-linked SusC/RagA family outer membrane protein